jgi:hypothetical protein
MNITRINLSEPRKLLAATMLTASIAAGASSLTSTQQDSFEKEKIEVVNQSSSKKIASVIKGIDEYDSKVINNIGGESQKEFTKEHKTLIRFLVGLMMSVIGSMVGEYRDEKGRKHAAGANKGANIGFAAGFVLPGVTSAVTLVSSLGLLAGAAGSTLSKGSKLAGKISSGLVGAVSAFKLFF